MNEDMMFCARCDCEIQYGERWNCHERARRHPRPEHLAIAKRELARIEGRS